MTHIAKFFFHKFVGHTKQVIIVFKPFVYQASVDMLTSIAFTWYTLVVQNINQAQNRSDKDMVRDKVHRNFGNLFNQTIAKKHRFFLMFVKVMVKKKCTQKCILTYFSKRGNHRKKKK